MKVKIARAGAPTTHLYVSKLNQEEKKMGASLPVAFVLPGGPGADHTAYQKYACLQTVSDLIFHDPRGCGQSDKGELSSYTMDNYIDDIETMRQHFGLDKITLIGKSYGSMCALGYAIRYPHAMNKLILAAGAPSYRFLETAKKTLNRIGTPEQIKIGEKLWNGSFKTREEVLHFFQLTNILYSIKARSQPELFDLTKKSNQFSHEVLNEGFKNQFWHFDYEHQLNQVSCPTLILAGKEDWINDIKYAELMAKRIPHSKLHIFEGASHAMEADVTDEYFQRIADFIQF